MLTKEQILKAEDKETIVLDIPEWGGEVRIKSLTAYELDLFESSVVDGKNKNYANLRARLAAQCLVDEEGNRLFQDTEVVHLGKKRGRALKKIFDACQELNGYSDKDIKDLEKNSEAAPSEDSATG